MFNQAIDTLKRLTPGVALCSMIGMSATFVSDHYGGPTILYALLMGMSLNHLSQEGKYVAGVEFTAKTVLRFGIAFLGARITIEQIMSLGMTPILIILIAVPSTIFFGMFCGRLLKLDKYQSLLTGCSVGICGASAALAVAAVLPQQKNSERNLIFTVIGVTALSTLAMIAYPLLVSAVGFDETQAGIFVGATIHDVAQVVGAGYIISENTGDIATFTKLLRVAALVPVVIVVSIIISKQAKANNSHLQNSRMPLPLPGFLMAFVVIVLINSSGYMPALVSSTMTEISRWCLIIAMVSLGMKASFKELSTMGWAPMFLLIAETIFLTTLVTIWLLFT